MQKIYYQLTYFDCKENKRKSYLNGTSWTNAKDAKDEFDKIMKEEKRKERIGVYSSRKSWAIDCIKNKKRTLFEKLN